MSKTATTNINEKDKKSERTTNMDDQDNKGFPALIIVVILLACIWLLAGFTIFQYTAVIILVIQFVKTFNSNSTSNNNEINNSSLSQVCMECSRKTRNDTISASSATTYNSTTLKVKG
jgi:phosphatidylserine synthase